ADSWELDNLTGFETTSASKSLCCNNADSKTSSPFMSFCGKDADSIDRERAEGRGVIREGGSLCCEEPPKPRSARSRWISKRVLPKEAESSSFAFSGVR